MVSEPTDQRLQLTTADGLKLEAELRTVPDPVAAAVICHPHPQYGGNMDNNVVGALFDQLADDGAVCIRFNFRGGGGSEGQHGNGQAERADVVAAIDELAGRWPELPLLLAGYSFGADVSLSVTDPRISAWLAVAPPLRVIEVEQMGAGVDPRPKRIVTGSADDFRPPADAERATAGWTNRRIDVAEGADHFFTTGMDAVRATGSDAIRSLTTS